MIGDNNPFPFQLGGGPSLIDATYKTISDMVGMNGTSDDPDSIESLWRRSKVEGLTAISTYDERAALQAFPTMATDHLPLWEVALGLEINELEADQNRRNEIVPRYTGTPRAWTLAIQDAIQRIDNRASILVREWLNVTVTMKGKFFQPYAPIAGQAYDLGGSRTATAFPNANDKNECYIFYDIGNGQSPSREVIRRSDQMREAARSVLPGWVKTRLVYAIGFTLDSDLLDATGFGT